MSQPHELSSTAVVQVLDPLGPLLDDMLTSLTTEPLFTGATTRARYSTTYEAVPSGSPTRSTVRAFAAS